MSVSPAGAAPPSPSPSTASSPSGSGESQELDPRIQLELEKLNTETAEINKLELELEESNTTFRMLLNETTRRLKGLAQRLGNSVERARPYHEAAATAQEARAACQRAAVAYQRASEIHAAAKESVALAEQNFKSNHWQFDNAWQEMLNHATMKVMDAENKKKESGLEHQKRAQIFTAAESKVQHLEEQLRRHIIKSRPYFDEKQLCQEQLNTQKERIKYLETLVSKAKLRYSQSLRALESISEEIHMKRGHVYGDAIGECPVGPREPGVGAENHTDYSLELERHDLALRTSPVEHDDSGEETKTLEELRRRVQRLAARPVEGGSSNDIAWETELNETVNQLDHMLMLREKAQQAKTKSLSSNTTPRSVKNDSDDSDIIKTDISNNELSPNKECNGSDTKPSTYDNNDTVAVDLENENSSDSPPTTDPPQTSDHAVPDGTDEKSKSNVRLRPVPYKITFAPDVTERPPPDPTDNGIDESHRNKDNTDLSHAAADLNPEKVTDDTADNTSVTQSVHENQCEVLNPNNIVDKSENAVSLSDGKVDNANTVIPQRTPEISIIFSGSEINSAFDVQN